MKAVVAQHKPKLTRPRRIAFPSGDAISPIDPTTEAVLASACVAQVTTTPAIYAPVSESAEGTGPRQYKPMLIVSVPSLRNPRIAIRPMRYSIWSATSAFYPDRFADRVHHSWPRHDIDYATRIDPR